MSHEAYKRKLWAKHLASLPKEMPDVPEPEPEPTPEPTTRPVRDTPQGRWYRRNSEHVAEYNREWRKAHPMTEEERARKRARDKARYRTDPEYRERKKAQQKARYERIKNAKAKEAACRA